MPLAAAPCFTYGVPLSPRFLVCAGFFAWGALPCGAVRAQEIPGEATENSAPVSAPRGRIGAARALEIVDSQGKPLAGNFSDPAWETRGGGLFFTREFAGTRNIWRAFPDPRDTSRYPRWRALPITPFAAPLFAFGARPLEGDRALLMISNAASSLAPAQATRFDLLSPTVRVLTDEIDGVSQVAPAPDGNAFAFSTFSRRANSRGQRGGLVPTVSIQSLGERPAPAQPLRFNAWRPAWQGQNSLLVEDVPSREISRLTLNERTLREIRATKIVEGSSISSSRDGSTLVVVGNPERVAPLYLLAGDGSGLTALSSTEGAQSPSLSSDGRWLAFTAPLEGQERGLWVLPLQSAPASDSAPVVAAAPATVVPPAVPALPVAPPAPAPGLSPLPSAPFSPDTPPLFQAPPPSRPVAAPARPVAVRTRVAAPVAQIRAVQNAPRGAVAIWGLASGAGASATLEIGQGALPRRWEAREILLPLAPGEPLLVWSPPATARGVWNFRLTVSGPGGAAQSLFTAQLPLAPTIPSPSATFGSMPAGGPLPSAPLPDLPAAPPSFPPPLPPLSPLPPAPPVRQNPSNPATGFPIQPAPPRVFPNPPRAVPNPLAPSFGPNGGRDAASFNVSNTLAQMKAGQSVTVTFWALNKGTRTWETGPAPGGTVRLVTRWIRFDNGNRNGWTYQTMKTPVAPGARTRWDFQLVAPRQPGRYKLIYALQRVPQSWAPPAYNAAQETWPGDIAPIAFAVVVKP